jgi:hypothetical protein
LEPRRLLSAAPALAGAPKDAPKSPAVAATGQPPVSQEVPAAPVVALAPDRFEPNGSFAQATELGTVTTRTEPNLSIDAPADTDYFHFTASTAGAAVITVRFSTAQGDLDFAIYDSAQQLVNVSSGTGDVESLTLTVVPGAAYYVHVYGYAGDTNPAYELSVDNSGAPPADDLEPNDSPSTATPLGLRGAASFTGLTIHSATDVDYFPLVAAATGTLTADLSFVHAAGNLDLFVYDAALNLVGSSTTTTDAEHVAVPCTAGATYYVVVTGAGGATNPSYDLQIQAPDAPPDRFEPNDSVAQAAPLGTFTSHTESGLSIHASDNDDYFSFVAAATGKLAVTLTFVQSRGDLDLSVYANGTTQPPITSSGVGDTEVVYFNAVAGQTYYFKVAGFGGALNDAYSLAIAPPPVPAADRFEPNDTFETAADLGVVATRAEDNLSVHAPNNDDYYKFVPAASGTFTAEILFDGRAGDLDLYLYNGVRVQLRTSAGLGNFERVTFDVNAGETYYLRAIGDSGDTNTYSLNITSDPPFWLESTNNLNYAFSGTSSAPVLTLFSGSGRLTADAATTIPNLTVNLLNDATLTTPTDQHLAALHVADHATFAIDASAGARLVTTDALQVDTTARLDLGAGALLLRDTTAVADTLVLPLLRQAYHRGRWDGAGITSSVAASTAASLTNAVGYRYVPAASSSATWLLIAYAPYGDANLDARIDADDAAALVLGVATGSTAWSNGNFNYDTGTNADDYLLFTRAAAFRPAPRASAQSTPALATPPAATDWTTQFFSLKSQESTHDLLTGPAT